MAADQIKTALLQGGFFIQAIKNEKPRRPDGIWKFSNSFVVCCHGVWLHCASGSTSTPSNEKDGVDWEHHCVKRFDHFDLWEDQLNVSRIDNSRWKCQSIEVGNQIQGGRIVDERWAQRFPMPVFYRNGTLILPQEKPNAIKIDRCTESVLCLETNNAVGLKIAAWITPYYIISWWNFTTNAIFKSPFSPYQ